MIVVQRYNSTNKKMWDQFVKTAKNSHFIFYRDYMDYHADCFQDHSLMFFNEKNSLLAIFAANEKNGVLYSHKGLTFGGMIVDDSMKTIIMLELFKALLDYCKQSEIAEVFYKKAPYIYSKFPAEEDLYALFRVHAELYRRDVSTTILLTNKIKYQEQRIRTLKKAKKSSLFLEESTDFQSYFTLLNNILLNKYDTKAVHSFDEMLYLKDKFPNNIKLFVAYDNAKTMLAGVLVYTTDTVIHAQYLANSIKGKEVGALDLIIDHLVTTVYKNHHFFDFGISNENDGRYLNEGLILYKEGFGARAVCHDFYKIKVK